MRDKPLLSITISTFFFSIMEVLVKSLERIPTHQVVFFRALIAFLICATYVKAKGIPFWGNNKRWLFSRGLFGTGALILYFYTLKHMPLATAVTLQKLSPFFTLVFAQWVLGERVRPRQWMFFALALAGVGLIKGFDTRVSLAAASLGVMAAVCSGMAYNSISRLKFNEHPMTIILYFPLVTLPLVGPYTLTHWTAPTALEWVLLIAVGVAVQIAQYFMTIAFQAGQASQVSIFYFLGTVMAAGNGWLLFGEQLSLATAIGITIILLAIILNSRSGSRERSDSRSVAG